MIHTAKHLIVPALQPIVDVKTRSVSHYEMLARLQGKSGIEGFGALIKAAERFGFISDIDLVMLAKSFDLAEDLGTWISVNLSPETIRDKGDEVLFMLRESGTRARSIILEITETAPVQELDGLVNFVAEVRRLGTRLAADDYGDTTGWMTEEVIGAIRPEFIKIDGTVFEQTDGGDGTYARARLLASRIGAQLVGEWVDSEEKYRFLRSRGVEYCQGALFGMPTVRQETQPIDTWDCGGMEVSKA